MPEVLSLRGERIGIAKKYSEQERPPGRDMQEVEASLRTEVEKSELRVRAEIIQSQNRLVFWVAGLLLAQGALYLTLQSFFNFCPETPSLRQVSISPCENR